MSDISPDISFRISQQGAQEVKQSLAAIDQQLNQTTASTDTHGKSVSKLTQFYREERSEHRQANFLFKESRDVIMTASFAMMAFSNASEGGSEASKKLSKSMTEAFGSFMAADFAIKGLGLATGGTATAISALIGVGIGLVSFFQNTDKEAEKAAENGVKKFEARMRGLSNLGVSREIDSIAKAIKDNEAAIGRITSDESNYKIRKIRDKEGNEYNVRELTPGAAGLLSGYNDEIKRLREGQKLGKDILDDKRAEDRMLTGILEKQESKIEKLQKEVKEARTLTELQERQAQLAKERDHLDRLSSGREYQKQQMIANPQAMGYMGSKYSLARPSLKSIYKIEDTGNADFAHMALEEVRRLNREENIFIDSLAQGFSEIGSGLDALGIKSDSFLSKLIQGVQEAVKISQILTSMDQGTTSTTGGTLGIIGTALKFLPLLGLAGMQGGTPSPAIRKNMIAMLQDAERKGKV